MSELLAWVQPYINYEEDLGVEGVEKNNTFGNLVDNRCHLSLF